MCTRIYRGTNNVMQPVAPVSKSLKHKTISTAAADEIRSRILCGSFAPGFQLKQEDLAREFGISRIPIREALLLLESEGLVRIMPHRGAVVVELSAEEIEELFNMRLLFEPFLLERSAPHLTSDDFEMLDDILARYEDSIGKQDVARWNDLNVEFHLSLYSHARSPRILATVRTLLNECDRHTRIQLSNIEADRKRAMAEHADMVRLCRAGKFAEAAGLLHAHIDHVRAGLVELLGKKHEAGEAA
jgi:DNA-binding GntR family transcriptional regulator